jgi:hypothetical protein
MLSRPLHQDGNVESANRTDICTGGVDNNASSGSHWEVVIRKGEPKEMVVALIQRFAAVFVLLLSLLTSVLAQNPASKSPIDAKMRQSDERLNAPVTFSADRIYLGELLEALSAKTGVTLSMDNTDSFSGILVACDLKQIPLADVMNSLWSLIGSKSGVWEWKADTHQTPTCYSLQPTLNARKLGERLHQAMQASFEAQIELMIQRAFMPPEERKATVDRFAESLDMDDLMHAKQYARVIDLEPMWAVVRLFANALSPDQRTQVLRGVKIDIPFSSLSPEDLHTAQQRYDWNPTLPPADTFHFCVARFKSDFTATVLQFDLQFEGEKRFGVEGSFFMTTMTDRLQHLYEDWILPGDLRTMDADTRPITALAAVHPEAIWNRAPLLDRTIAQLAATEQVSFMAVVPEYYHDSMSGPLGKTPTQYFTELWTTPELMHKWRENILLVTDPKWFYGDEAQYPYGTVKRLRASLQKQNGLLSLEDIVEPITTLSTEQMDYLTEEFPFSGIRKVELTGASRRVVEPLPQAMLSLCALYRRYPKVWSKQGLRIDLKMQALLHDSKLWPTWLQAGEEVTALRIVDSPNPASADLHQTYTLQATTSRQKWRDVASFSIVRIAPKIQP